ncbi:HNH endonuclease [Pantoea sp. AV62]
MAHLGHSLDGLHVHHDCHNRKCINPSHLMVLTPEEHSEIHGKEWSNGHDIGPALPKNTTKAYMMARQAVTEYLQALPEPALVIPKARPNQFQATTAKALRMSTMSRITGISGYLVAEVVRKMKLYEFLRDSVTVGDN